MKYYKGTLAVICSLAILALNVQVFLFLTDNRSLSVAKEPFIMLTVIIVSCFLLIKISDHLPQQYAGITNKSKDAENEKESL